MTTEKVGAEGDYIKKKAKYIVLETFLFKYLFFGVCKANMILNIESETSIIQLLIGSVI